MSDTDMDKELDWNDTIQKDDADFVVLEDGDYDFSIHHYERGRTSGEGKLGAVNQAIVYFDIITENNDGPQLTDRFPLHSRMEWKLSQLFRSVGLKKEGEALRMDWNRLPGLTGRCRVVKKKNSDRAKNPDGFHNEIEKLYPREPGPSGRSWAPGKF